MQPAQRVQLDPTVLLVLQAPPVLRVELPVRLVLPVLRERPVLPVWAARLVLLVRLA